MTTLSIGIPVYNQAGTIAETLDAVLSQTQRPHEIVVSENHSTDGTRGIVERYGDRLRIVRPPQHLGMAANWNYCVRSCTGDWVGLCSGDDHLRPNYVTAMTRGSEVDPHAVFVMGGWERANEIAGRVESHYLLSMGRVTLPPRTVRMLLAGPKASFAAFCFKRTAFDRIGGYDESFEIIQDWMLQFDLAPLGAFIRVDELIATYRIAERPELEARRVPRYVRDIRRYLSDRIWTAEAHGVGRRDVVAAARSGFLELLRYMRARQYQPDAETAAGLAQVAAKVGVAEIWPRWQAGWTPPAEVRVAAWIKRPIRAWITALRARRAPAGDP